MKHSLILFVLLLLPALGCGAPPPIEELAAAHRVDGRVHHGDVVIQSVADAALWNEVTKIDGDLTIADGLLGDIALPSLVRVTGDLVVNYARPKEHYPTTRVVDLPVLARVDGSVTLLSKRLPDFDTYSLTALLGLPALAQVGCNLAVSLEAGGVNVSGLPALTVVPHDLSIVGGDGDFAVYSPGMLPVLGKVGGRVTLDLGHNVFGALLPVLADVEGDFAVVDGNVNAPSLAALARVDGEMLLDNTGFYAEPDVRIFPALETVRGRLTFRHLFDENTETLHLGKENGIGVGGLVVDGNATLESLGPATFRVRRHGPVTITGNPALCDSVVQAFLAALPGWRGVATVAGNRPGC